MFFANVNLSMLQICHSNNKSIVSIYRLMELGKIIYRQIFCCSLYMFNYTALDSRGFREK